jgi:hypothetical protein
MLVALLQEAVLLVCYSLCQVLLAAVELQSTSSNISMNTHHQFKPGHTDTHTLLQ